MTKSLYCFLLITLAALPLKAAEVPSSLSAKEQQVKNLEEQLKKAVDDLNASLEKAHEQGEGANKDQLSEQTSTSLPAPDHSEAIVDALKNLTGRVEILEKKLEQPAPAKLVEQAPVSPKAELDKIREDAEKKANELAPKLATGTPAVAQYDQANALLKNKEYKKAADAFGTIMNEFPSDPYAVKSRVHLAEALQALGDFTKAEDMYTEALKTKMDDSLMIDCRLGLLEVNLALNKASEACSQITILQKEKLTENQLKRLKDSQGKAHCKKP
ncbi:MAG: tetratricopeptide repeat protein [Alphaproteobacteria bacterium]|nr:tetratricopeptide repeat protein [Alphaproteobacteria bacterium]